MPSRRRAWPSRVDLVATRSGTPPAHYLKPPVTSVSPLTGPVSLHQNNRDSFDFGRQRQELPSTDGV
uniref:Uncharacterized protein n=1 Tax=Rhizophora mucronata TaxID=61149 RepID=A0A2P2JAT0_RHIMU